MGERIVVNLFTKKRNNSWQYVISYKADGKWKQTSKQGFALERDAKKAGEKRMAGMIEDPPISGPGMTFKQVADLYALDGHKSPNTLALYNYKLNVLEDLQGLQIDQITYSDILPIISEYGRTHKYQSTRMLRAYGISIFRYAINKLKVAKYNPFSEIDLRAPVVSDKAPKRALTVSQINALIADLDGPKALLVALMGFCGLRLGEARGLTRSDFDLKNNLIHIRQQKLCDGSIGPLKTQRSYRVVPLPKSVKQLYLEQPISLGGFLFPGGHASNSFKPIFKRHGFDISPHELRHSYTTNLIQAGVDFKTVAMLIGDSVEMVFKVYSHVNQEMFDRAQKIIDQSF